MITQEEFLKIANNLKKAEEDDTPFIVVKDDEVAVVGDANKTELKKNTYNLSFRFPLEDERFKTEDSKVVGSFYLTEIEFKDVFISPRKDLKIVASVMKIMPYFKKLYADGTLADRTNDELFAVFTSMSDEVLDAIYLLVQCVMGIPNDIIDNLLPSSALYACAKLIEDYPEIFNEADVFFG